MPMKVRHLASALLAAVLFATAVAAPAHADVPEQVLAANSIASVATKAKPSVVGILTTMKANRSTEKGRAAGTGFVYKEGVIITNAHVVENAAEVKILYADKTVETVQPSQIAMDATSDVAVVRVNTKGLVPLAFADSDDVTVGQTVVAVGNPLGFRLGNSVSAGILSGVGRALGSGYPFLQVDAPINPGNSGGPLFNLQGEVIGINSAKMSEIGVEGLGFAIPANTARQIADTLLRDGKVERATLGIELDEGWEAYFGVPDAEGVTIANVIADGPVGTTSLRPGDKLVKLDDRAIYTTDDVFAFLAGKKPGESVTVTVKRRGQLLSAKVKLASQEELRKLAEGQGAEEVGGILIGLTSGQIQEAAEFGRSWSRGMANINQDYMAVSGSDYAILYTEYLYVARRMLSAYEFGFQPGVGLQQAAAKEIHEQVEVWMELNGSKPNFLDGATFFLEQEEVARVGGAVEGLSYTTSADGKVVIANAVVRFPTAALSSTEDMRLTVRLADGSEIDFHFSIKDLR